jgi:hypothetical protein
LENDADLEGAALLGVEDLDGAGTRGCDAVAAMQFMVKT